MRSIVLGIGVFVPNRESPRWVCCNCRIQLIGQFLKDFPLAELKRGKLDFRPVGVQPHQDTILCAIIDLSLFTLPSGQKYQ